MPIPPLFEIEQRVRKRIVTVYIISHHSVVVNKYGESQGSK